MKTAIIKTPGVCEVCEVEKPVVNKGEALLKLLYGGICGSDLGTFKGANAYVSYPRIPGHEFSAEIVEIGENEQGLKKGMIVTCNPYFNCGQCYSCKKGKVNVCEQNQTMGVQRDGAFSEYITMPIERIYDGQGLDAETLVLIEPFCISYHGVKQANVKEGDNVLVIGAGTIGVLAGVAAKTMGANVTICDVAKEKLDYAFDTFKFDNKIHSTSKEVFENEVKAITNGHGFDAVIEAVGLPQTFQNSIDAVCFGGEISIIGISKQNIDDFCFTLIQKKEINLHGSRNALKSDFIELIELVKSGKVDISKIITDRYAFNDINKALVDFSGNSSKMLKVILDFTK